MLIEWVFLSKLEAFFWINSTLPQIWACGRRLLSVRERYITEQTEDWPLLAKDWDYNGRSKSDAAKGEALRC